MGQLRDQCLSPPLRSRDLKRGKIRISKKKKKTKHKTRKRCARGPELRLEEAFPSQRGIVDYIIRNLN